MGYDILGYIMIYHQDMCWLGCVRKNSALPSKIAFFIVENDEL